MKMKRLVSALLVLCMTAALFAGVVSAAEVSNAVRSDLVDDAEAAGFAEEYTDRYHFVDAGREGDAVTAKLPHKLLGTDDRAVAVAVRAVDNNGNALAGHKTRIVLGTYSNGSVTVTYQENGCRYFAMMPTQGMIDHGTIHSLKTEATEVANGVYDIYVEARLIMSDDLATYVVVNKTDERLLDMRFTCYLENEVINAGHNVELQDLVFDDPHGIYDLIDSETYATEDGLVISYKLDEAEFRSWMYESASSLKSILQTEVVMSCHARETERDLREGANYNDEIWTYGHLDLTYEPNGRMQPIPAVNQKLFHIPAKLDYIVLDEESGRPQYPTWDGDDYNDDLVVEEAPVPEWLNGTDHIAYIIGRDSGLVEPNATITRAEVATIFFRLLKNSVREKHMTQENEFSDVNEGQWFNCAISTMAELGVVKGRPDGTFRPNDPITRGEFAAIAARFDGREADGTARFADIKGHWAAPEISRAYQNGWVTGYPNGTFCPDQAITRAEAMTLVNRVLHRNPDEPEDLLDNMITWADNMDENVWYYLAVQEATNSHEYDRERDGHEYWTELERIPDWAELEK